VRRYNFVGKVVATLELDPESRVPDITRANNTWKGATSTPPVP
jgi:hypothetical protein